MFFANAKKIQAFTLGELLVVMVISSIVVTVSFMALGNIQRQVKSVNETFSFVDVKKSLL